ncbi:MAG: hypothetical protein NTY09_01930 [bacterium]|nr:hypothetical protein [bacterium]
MHDYSVYFSGLLCLRKHSLKLGTFLRIDKSATGLLKLLDNFYVMLLRIIPDFRKLMGNRGAPFLLHFC